MKIVGWAQIINLFFGLLFACAELKVVGIEKIRNLPPELNRLASDSVKVGDWRIMHMTTTSKFLNQEKVQEAEIAVEVIALTRAEAIFRIYKNRQAVGQAPFERQALAGKNVVTALRELESIGTIKRIVIESARHSGSESFVHNGTDDKCGRIEIMIRIGMSLKDLDPATFQAELTECLNTTIPPDGVVRSHMRITGAIDKKVIEIITESDLAAYGYGR